MLGPRQTVGHRILFLILIKIHKPGPRAHRTPLVRMVQAKMPRTRTTHRKPVQHHAVLIDSKSRLQVRQSLKHIRFTSPAVSIIPATIHIQLQPLTGTLIPGCPRTASIHPLNEIHLVHLICTTMQHDMNRPSLRCDRIHTLGQRQCIRLHRSVHSADVPANGCTNPQIPVRSTLKKTAGSPTPLRQHSLQLPYPRLFRKLRKTQHPRGRFFENLHVRQ